MKKLSFVALLVVAVLALGTSDAIACKGCGCSKKKAAATCSKKASCPLAVALKKANLSAEQQKKVDALLANCKTACKKASDKCCPSAKASGKAAAMKNLQAELAKVLTADQMKGVKAAFGKRAAKKAGSCSKKASGCGK